MSKRGTGTLAVTDRSPTTRERRLCVEVREPEEQRRQVLEAALVPLGVELVGAGARKVRDVVVMVVLPDEGVFSIGRRHSRTRVLALVDAPCSDTVNQLLAAGARAVLDRSSDPETVAGAAVAVGRDYVVLPSSCSVGTIQALRRPEALTVNELRWMRALALGKNVGTLATTEGYSEREMYRKLSIVYRKLRSTGRSEALDVLARADQLRPQPAW